MAHYELIVIGAGPGGYEAALHAAKLGKKVAVVEKREAGGTCLNRGCIPTKTLLHSSQIFHDAKHGAHAGIHTDDIRADMTEIFAYKREISQKLSSGIESLFKTAKIDFLRGTALITAPGAVRVTDAEGGANDYTCDDILIATGSVPSRPPIPGLEFAMTSDELLEGCDHLYRSIVIIGGGVIGIEFATFYADLGCEVTVIEGMDRLLPNMDKEPGQKVEGRERGQGFVVVDAGGREAEKSRGAKEGEHGGRGRAAQKGGVFRRRVHAFGRGRHRASTSPLKWRHSGIRRVNGLVRRCSRISMREPSRRRKSPALQRWRCVGSKSAELLGPGGMYPMASRPASSAQVTLTAPA